VVDNPYFLEKYNSEFDKLWKSFEKNAVGMTEEVAAKKI